VPKQQRKAIAKKYLDAWRLEKEAANAAGTAEDIVNQMGLNSDDSRSRFDTYKPPK